MPPKKDTPSIAVRSDGLSGEKCIITGEIDGMSRKAAEQVLINAGATIEKSLNKKVTLVVLGENAGQKKLDKIQELGCEKKEWDDVIADIKNTNGGGGDDVEDPMDEDDDDDDDGPEEEEEEEEKPIKTTKKAKAPAKAPTKAPAKASAKSSATANSKAKKAAPAAKASGSGSGNDPEFLEGKKVIITGTIPGHERKAAQAILEDAGADFAKSLNKQVELVILGSKAGPDKMAKIEELGVETIEWADLAQKLGLEVAPEKKTAEVEAGAAPDSIDGLTVIITGDIDGQTRASAQKILEAQGAKFAKSLNKSVELVVLGNNAGPEKLNKIAAQGTDTCSWDDLVEKLGIDAEANEPPRKKTKKA